ncbi:MAG: hypothetical protein P8X73_00335 [Ignavibacteriaceae bacterium]
MKIPIVELVTIFILLFCSIVLAQLPDDIRIFPAADHQTENSITIDPTNPNHLIVIGALTVF